MRAVHVILPNDIDDPTTPSGGNVYDRRICRGLGASGWSVREHAVRGAWPSPGAGERAAVARVLAGLPDGALVLLDGLVASAVPDELTPQARRLRLVVLVHMPLGDADTGRRDQERQALSAAVGVVATSHWSRQRLIEVYGLEPTRIHAAPPGVDPAALVPGSDAGSELLCVAAVTPQKGYDLLVDALARLRGVTWRCVCVGPLDRDRAFADQVRDRARSVGIADRLTFAGPRTGRALENRYAAADLLVLPSRGETYGMVVTEALARGIPVLVTGVNGVPEALGRAPDGSLPGLLVPPGDPAVLAGALRRWLAEPDLRRRLRRSARDRRARLTGWAATSALVSDALSGFATRLGATR